MHELKLQEYTNKWRCMPLSVDEQAIIGFCDFMRHELGMTKETDDVSEIIDYYTKLYVNAVNDLNKKENKNQ